MIEIAYVNATHPLPTWQGVRVQKITPDDLATLSEGISLLVVDVNTLAREHYQRVFDNPFNIPSLALVHNQQQVEQALTAHASDYIFASNLTKRTLRHRVRRLIASPAQARRLIQDNPDGILVVSDEGEILFANRAAQALFRRKKLVGNLFGYPIVANGMIELDVLAADGSVRVVEMRSTVVRWDGQRAKIAALRDMTERAILQKTAEEARQKAEHANHVKDVFLMAVSHELRTPLTSIVGFTDTLLADDMAWSDEERTEFMTVIREEADKLQTLIDDILNHSTATMTSAIEKEATTLQAVLDTSRIQLNMLTASHTFQVELPDELPGIHADPFRLSQVIVNVVENATKYAPAGSVITLTASHTADDTLQVAISDQGDGIPEEEWQIIFEPLARTRTLERIEGVGLGLAIAQDIINKHGGDIWIEQSSLETGTTFIFEIPLSN